MQEILTLLDPDRLTTIVVTFIPQVFAGALIFFAFWVFSRLVRPPLRAALARASFDRALIKLLIDQVLRVVILAVGLLMALGQLGINVGAALAGLGVAGIAVGFAAQDSLANTIAGLLIFWDKPFQVGDVVQTQDQYGTVSEITLRTTRIRTPDNTYVVIPNKQIIEDVLVNHSMYGETRVRVPVGIAYKEDVEVAREVLLEAIRGMEGVNETPAPSVVVTELGDSSVNLELRIWIPNASKERPVCFEALERCKRALDRAGIEIPFPHLQLFVDAVQEEVWERLERIPALSAGNGDGE